MFNIDEETLEALFLQSRFTLKPDMKEQWLKELNHWVDFFRIEIDLEEDLDDAHGNKLSQYLRPDIIKESLTLNNIKTLSSRFLDGFISLPKTKQESKNGDS